MLLLLNGERTFEALCDGSSTLGADGTCDESDLKLNLIFTVSSTSYGAAPIVLGMVIDRYGPRTMCVLSSAFLSVGFLLVTVSSYPDFDLFMVGFVLIATFGVGVQFSCFHVANLFPKRHGTVTSFLSAMFGVSSLMYPLLHALWSATDGGLSRRGLFAAYTVVVCLCTVFAWFLPRRAFDMGDECGFSWKLGFHAVPRADAAEAAGSVAATDVLVLVDHSTTGAGATKDAAEGVAPSTALAASAVGDDGSVHSSQQHDASTAGDAPQLAASADAGSAEAGEDGIQATATAVDKAGSEVAVSVGDGGDVAGKGTPASDETKEAAAPCNDAASDASADVGSDVAAPGCLQQSSTSDYILNAAFTCLTFWCVSVYLGSVNLQLEEIDGPPVNEGKIDRYTSAFSWIAPIGALFSPVIGMIIDKYGFGAAYVAVVIVGHVHAVFALIPSIPAQIITFFAYTISQEGLFATMFSYLGQRFGYANIGMLSGLLLFFCGLVNLAVFPVTAAVVDGAFSFETLNIGILVFKVLLLGMYPVYLLTGARPARTPIMRHGESAPDHAGDAKPAGVDSASNASAGSVAQDDVETAVSTAHTLTTGGTGAAAVADADEATTATNTAGGGVDTAAQADAEAAVQGTAASAVAVAGVHD